VNNILFCNHGYSFRTWINWNWFFIPQNRRFLAISLERVNRFWWNWPKRLYQQKVYRLEKKIEKKLRMKAVVASKNQKFVLIVVFLVLVQFCPKIAINNPGLYWPSLQNWFSKRRSKVMAIAFFTKIEWFLD